MPGKLDENDIQARQLFKKSFVCRIKKTLLFVRKANVRLSLFNNRRCTLGNQESCSLYASMCLTGKGGPKDCTESLAILQTLCDEKSDARACVRLGAEYLKPDGCLSEPSHRNLDQARKIFTRACDDLGHPNACQILAVMYKTGDGGVPVDLALSDKYKQKTKDLYKVTGEELGRTKVKPGN